MNSNDTGFLRQLKVGDWVNVSGEMGHITHISSDSSHIVVHNRATGSAIQLSATECRKLVIEHQFDVLPERDIPATAIPHFKITTRQFLRLMVVRSAVLLHERKLDLVEGLRNLIWRIRYANDLLPFDEYLTLFEIGSEAQHFPIDPSERELWSESGLRKVDEERRQWENKNATVIDQHAQKALSDIVSGI
ncbi:MAG: hypothetical protein AAF525_06605 [Pseudomonadota bacterium]